MLHVALRQAALVAILAQAAPEALKVKPRTWDVPKAVQAVDVPQKIEAGGMPVTMHAVRSKLPAEELERYFIAEFSKAGLYLTPAVQKLTVHRQVTGLDVETRIAYTVFLQENADRSTNVIITETYTAEVKKPPSDPKFAPLMPSPIALIVNRTEGAETLSYRVKATPEQAQAFYRDVLTREGYRETGPLQFERATDVLTVHARQAGELTAISIIHTQAGSRTKVSEPSP